MLAALRAPHLQVSLWSAHGESTLARRLVPALRNRRTFREAFDHKNAGEDAPSRGEGDQRIDQFVKRLVGLPGDTIEVRSGSLYVNGTAIETTDTGANFQDDVGRTLRVANEDLEGHVHTILDDERSPGHDIAPTQIDAGRYFMMGDNRDYSNDSRFWGTVRLAEMKGPAFLLYWSWDWDGAWVQLLNPLHWWDLMTKRMRWDRIGNSIQ